MGTTFSVKKFVKPPLAGLVKKIPSEVLDRRLTDIELKTISDQMLQWKNKAVYLGLSDTDIENIEKNGENNEERKFLLLMTWREKRAYKASLRELILISHDRGWIDFARRFCKELGYYKEGTVAIIIRPSVS